MNREEQRKQGERLKKQVKILADQLDRSGKLKLKIALMQGETSETVARRLISGEYDRTPRKDLIENMEGVLAKFGKAKAS